MIITCLAPLAVHPEPLCDMDTSFIPPTPLTREERYTSLRGAASRANSTPLYPAPEGMDEPMAISPSMLLTMKSSGASHPPEISDEKDLLAVGTRRWRRVEHLADQFWKRWRQNFLQECSRRSKWTRAKPNLKEHDVVLLKEKNVARRNWRLARIVRLISGKDNLVRRVLLKFHDGSGRLREGERAIVDLIYLFTPIN